MIKIKVPATSANLGPGFDALGLALTLYNEVWMEECDTVDIAAVDDTVIPTGTDNMIFQNARHLYELCGRPFCGLKVRQKNGIPMTRGLGSSSACIVAGLLGANALLGEPMERQELLSIAAHMEGHPDNIAPAILGGLVTSVMEGGQVYSVSVPVSDQIQFAVMIPPFEIKTEFARGILPGSLSRADAVFNLSRAALMTAALFSGRMENLKVAVQDRIHQPYRLGLIPGMREAFDAAYDLGAYGVYLSGAGPTIVGVIDARESKEDFACKLSSGLEQRGIKSWKVLVLDCDQPGAQVTKDVPLEA
ncbi:homoserine kinase [Solibaculum mannosilyticum]|uniref:homoserine kinase n=1 Tax=Solibaculum mannosilyticum TaxID=2780922 RepID=UPI0034AE5A8C